jgi:hypothetical protein
MNNKTGVVIEGLDLVEITKIVDSKSRKYQKMLLFDIEEIIDSNSEEYKLIRKAVLDHFNDYTRAIVGKLFGDIEVESWVS